MDNRRKTARKYQFLSTPSARRATQSSAPCIRTGRHFYPRPPRGGRLRPPRAFQDGGHFYPRPPRGGRLSSRPVVPSTCQFLSTPSARRATRCFKQRREKPKISIHALREEGDQSHTLPLPRLSLFLSTPSARRATLSSLNTGTGGADFYPRPPRGGRQCMFL